MSSSRTVMTSPRNDSGHAWHEWMQSQPQTSSKLLEAHSLKEEEHSSTSSLIAPVTRERLCNDILNTSVMAALVGGFALNNMHKPEDDSAMEIGIYMLGFMSVHACTCSALTSAFVYQVVNGMNDDCVEKWATKNKLLVNLAMVKFIMGTAFYIISVICISWKHLEINTFWKWMALMIGIMSCSTVALTAHFLRKSLRVKLG
mmetsp:Transcript_44829/g.97625  ORF Transcript_44829/g.97625 Transcript_44829/m.97625 type:complete len:202 (-) Transcript_44829:145-750(-)